VTIDEIKEVLACIDCRELGLHLNGGFGKPDGVWLQVWKAGACVSTGEPRMQKGRKWRISQHMTLSEIVQTALMACLAFEEHEVRERFTYCDAAIFSPHFDSDDLVALFKTRGHTGARQRGRELHPRQEHH